MKTNVIWNWLKNVCKNYNFRPNYQYKYLSVDLFWPIQIQVILGWTFYVKYFHMWIPFFRPIQIKIYLGLTKAGQYEYKYGYSDWYLGIKIQIWMPSTQKRLQLIGQRVQIVEKPNVLYTILTNNLSWNKKCSNLIKKNECKNAIPSKSMEFWIYLVHLWKLFCQYVLEHSCFLWDSGLTQVNRNDLERTQKTFLKLI